MLIASRRRLDAVYFATDWEMEGAKYVYNVEQIKGLQRGTTIFILPYTPIEIVQECIVRDFDIIFPSDWRVDEQTI